MLLYNAKESYLHQPIKKEMGTRTGVVIYNPVIVGVGDTVRIVDLADDVLHEFSLFGAYLGVGVIEEGEIYTPYELDAFTNTGNYHCGKVDGLEIVVTEARNTIANGADITWNGVSLIGLLPDTSQYIASVVLDEATGNIMVFTQTSYGLGSRNVTAWYVIDVRNVVVVDSGSADLHPSNLSFGSYFMWQPNASVMVENVVIHVENINVQGDFYVGQVIAYVVQDGMVEDEQLKGFNSMFVHGTGISPYTAIKAVDREVYCYAYDTFAKYSLNPA